MPVPTQNQMSTTRVGRPRRSSKRQNVIKHPATKDFVYLASPSEIDMVNGEALPRLIQFPIDGGLMGVPGSESGMFSWQAAVAVECERFGRVLVDPKAEGLELIAFGEKVEIDRDDDPNDPRSYYVCRYQGHKGIIHMPPWCKPRSVGSMVVWDKDPEGLTHFRRQVRDKMFGGIDSEIERLVRLKAEQDAIEIEADAKHRPTMARNAEVARKAITKPEPKPKAKPRRKTPTKVAGKD